MPSTDSQENQGAIEDLVVLVHGFSAASLVMWPLAQRLQKDGFRVRQWSYVTLFAKIELHASRLRAFLQADLKDEPRIHLVAHSMGCIVVRASLNELELKNLGRVVLLAPPNRGSPVAGFVSRFLGRILVPTRELASHPASFVHRLPDSMNTEIGIIAAKYDMLIPVKNTDLPSQSKHEVVPGTHSSILFSPSAWDKVSRFLRTGEF